MIVSTQTNAPISGHGDEPVVIVTARLKAAGLRITRPRLTILAAMVKLGQPASIEVIHEDLGRRGCDLVTVYRCMAVFEEIGIVRRSYLHNGTALFSLNVDDRPRYHVVSKTTKTVEELDIETTRELHAALLAIETLLLARGYTDVGHVAEFLERPRLIHGRPTPCCLNLQFVDPLLRRPSARSRQANTGVEPEQNQVADQCANDAHQAEHNQHRSREVNVFNQQSVQHRRTDHWETQHKCHDRTARDQLGKHRPQP